VLTSKDRAGSCRLGGLELQYTEPIECALEVVERLQDSGCGFQVQDVGLIFLSAMATSIVHEGMSYKLPTEEILGTTLFTLTLSTFIVGLLIILVGGAPDLTLPPPPHPSSLTQAFKLAFPLLTVLSHF